MNWINQYVAAVKRNLPEHMREDVGEELTDIILSNIDDKQGSLGRLLSDDETIALLDEYGHPEKVAARYIGRRQLIGPQWFGLYHKVLSSVLTMVVIYYSVSVLLSLLSGESTGLWYLIKNFLYEIFNTGVYATVVVTAVFYYLDSSPAGESLLARWHLQEMPAVDKPWIYIPMGDTFRQLAAAGLILFFLNSEVHIAQFLIQDGKSGSFSASEQIGAFIPWLNGAIIAFAGVRFINLVMPYWSGKRLLADAIMMLVLTGVLLPVLLSESIVVVSTTEVISADRHHFEADGLDITLRIIIGLFIAVILYEFAVAVNRLRAFYR